MNSNAKKWVAALRDGRFDQGQGSLRCNDARCCLGVACDVYQEETGQGEWKSVMYFGTSMMVFTVSEDDSDCALLPEAVQQWLGLAHSDAHWDTLKNDGCLVDMNDGHPPATFPEIADKIEEEPEGLFES